MTDRVIHILDTRVAGQAPETLIGMRFERGKIRFRATNRGDGQVPWDGGIPEELVAKQKAWFMPGVVHGTLPSAEEHFPALLDLLRDHLNMTGAKEGCGTGDCGACSVILDGRLVCSCLVLGVEAQGRKIETIEGMADGNELHPLQRLFISNAALQCGICTPGILIAAKNLLEMNPDPTEEEIRFGLAGNLCRCTGYDKIVRAVQAAAKEMRGA